MMRIIEIRLAKKFGGSWIACEAPGVEPAFPEPNGKQNAIDYARGRFGGSNGEIHVYHETGAAIVDKILIEAGGQHDQACFSRLA
jgi:hypothetical protein